MNAKPIFALSLLVNVGLGIALAMLLVNRPAPSSGGPEPAVASHPASVHVSAPADDTTNVVVQKIARKFDWRQVESADYKKYIANLRSIGCPKETIKDIIIADVNKLFEARRKEITASTNKFQYWKTGNMFTQIADPDRIDKLQALNKEKRDLLKELLGSAPMESVNLYQNFNPFETMLDFLSPEKQTQVTDTMTKYQSKMAKLFSNGRPDAEGIKKMMQMRKDMDSELQGMLLPEEYRQYQLRMSDTAMSMRYQLSGFDPSQQEFDAIYEIRKRHEGEYPMMGMGGPPSQADMDKAKSIKEAIDAQVKALLGDARYADYERCEDPYFQSFYRLTDKYHLAKEVVVKAFDMKKAAEEEAKKIRDDSTLTSEQRDAALSNIRGQTEAAMPQVLGEKAWANYKRQAKWLDGISMTAPAAK